MHPVGIMLLFGALITGLGILSLINLIQSNNEISKSAIVVPLEGNHYFTAWNTEGRVFFSVNHYYPFEALTYNDLRSIIEHKEHISAALKYLKESSHAFLIPYDRIYPLTVARHTIIMEGNVTWQTIPPILNAEDWDSLISLFERIA